MRDPVHAVVQAHTLTVLITGFGAFPGNAFNPTAALVSRLARRRRPALAGVRRIPHVFTTSYAAVEQELPELIRDHRPDAILMFGLAPRTPHLRVEMRARNARSRLVPDADGTVSGAARIRAGAPSTLSGRAPFAPLNRAAKVARVPVKLSFDAGVYLCNYLYWRALETSLDGDAAPLVVFIHVPKIRRANALKRPGRRRPSFAELERAGEAILLALVCAARHRS